MNSKSHVLLTVELPAGAASIEAAAKALGVEPGSIDSAFGVVPIDPAARKYALMLDERFVAGALKQKGVSGPHANPRIEPFGPPQP